MAPHFRHRALFIGPNARKAVNEGRADFVPVFFSDVPALFSSGAYPLDAVFANVTPPDAHGFCSLGVSVEAMHAAIAAAKTVIVQFNPSIPRTWGESFIHVSQIDLAVEVDQPPFEYPLPEIGPVEHRIGAFIADLIPDGATLQLGIGAIPTAVASLLYDKKDLGIHTEMFTDPIVDLVDEGRRQRRAEGAQPREARRHVPRGDAASCTNSSTTTRWSRCGRWTTRTTPMSSASSRT